MQSKYTLNDEQFKKLVKGVKKRINATLPQEHALSHQLVMQIMAQEMFSMTYEEVKSTIFSKPVDVKLPVASSPTLENEATKRDEYDAEHGYVEDATSNRDAHRMKYLKQALAQQIKQCVAREHVNLSALSDAVWITAKLSKVMTVERFKELKLIAHVINLVNAQQPEILIEMLDIHNRNTALWDTAADAVLPSFEEMLWFDKAKNETSLSLESYLLNLTLPRMIDLVTRETIPQPIRNPMYTLLSRLSPFMDDALTKGAPPNQVSHEQFSYVFMGHIHDVKILKNALMCMQ